jgi:hypothetical protein
MRHVKEIIEAVPFKLKLRFDNDEILTVDLESRLRKRAMGINSMYSQLLNPEYFKLVMLNKEMESIYWDNGMDFCSDVLYMLAKRIPFKWNDEK